MGDSFLFPFSLSQISFYITCLEVLVDYYKDLNNRPKLMVLSDVIDSIINGINLEIDYLNTLLDLYS